MKNVYKILGSLLAIGFLIVGCSEEKKGPNYKLVEKVDSKKNTINIPYKKFEYENGLTLIVHEDHSDPIAHVDVTYHVGSAREEIGRSGFAHFFEHMMFQGSDHVADEEHFRIINESGGTLNGTTNTDRTNYFETVPKNQLETALWLEADRMGFLLDAVTQKKFEVQRGTVKNERGQNYDNRPYGLVNEKKGQAIYEYGHPYSWPTIGYIEDLNRVDVEDLKKFFLRWYGPNNAVLTVAGDVDAKEVASLVEKYFGVIPKGPEVKPMDKKREPLDTTRYISYEDDKIKFPLLSISYPSVPRYHKDEAALDVLTYLISSEKNSVMYDAFTKTGLAVQAGGYNYCKELAGDMSFNIYAMPFGKNVGVEDLGDLEQLFDEALRKFEEEGVTEKDIQRYKSSTESYMVRSLASVSGKASKLAAYETFLGNPDFTQKDIDRYMSVTKEDVIRVYNKYIKNAPRVVLSVYPKGENEVVAQPDNFTPKMPNPSDADNSEYKNLVYNKAQDKPGFDRSKRPAPSENPVVQVPPYWTQTLDNGLEVIATQSDEVPMTSLRLSIDCGHMMESVDQSGIADIMASMLQESTENYSSEELSKKLETLGSNVSVSSNEESVVVYVSSLTKNLDETMNLVEEMLFKPAFNEEDFTRVKRQHIAGLQNMMTAARSIASQAVNKVTYKNGEVLATPNSGTLESASKINVDDVREYYESNFAPNISRLVIVSDLSKKEVQKQLAVWNQWEEKEVEELQTPVLSGRAKQLVFIDQPGAAQSEIRITKMAMPYDATGEFYKAKLMNYPVAGNFNSRLNLEIREGKNWSYGTAGRFYGRSHEGPYTIYGGILKSATDSAVQTYIDYLKEYASGGVTAEELAYLKSAIGQQDALKYETGRQKAGFISRILKYDLDADFKKEQTKILESITTDELTEMAKAFYNLDDMVIIVVGDKSAIGESVKAVAEKEGFEWIEMTVQDVFSAK